MAKGSGGTRYKSPVAAVTGIEASNPIMSDSRSLAESYLQDSSMTVEQRASKVFSLIRKDIETNGKSTIAPFKMSKVRDEDAELFEKITGEKIINLDIYSSVKALTHHQGGQKAERGKELSWDEKEDIPKRLSGMDVFENTGALVYTDYKIKVVIKPNQKIKINRKQTIVANHISASRVIDKKEFMNGVYREIRKK